MRKNLLTLGFLLALLGTSFVSAQTPPPGITGQAFRDWIKTNFYDGFHTTLGYSTARSYMYGYIDNENNQLTGVYSGYQLSWTYGSTGTNPAPINCEHTVPQSFFGSSEPMRSDIHHLFPTYSNWNSIRSSYSFGENDDNQTTKWMYLNQEQSSIPSSSINLYSEFANQTFEPREDHKGDCARAIFYFYTMYPTQAGSISSVGDINTLYQWHLQDPPDADEVSRNDGIETYQGNRNPFVDNPSWVADAWDQTPSGLSTPSNMQLTETTTSLDLSWGDITGETGYSLYRSTNNVSYTLLSTLAANATTYSDATVSASTTYYYYVEAFDGSQTSSGSSVVSGQLQGGSGGGNATDLFVSQYIEGSSYNKALEVANFTGAAVNLSGYVLKKQSNGSGSWGSDYSLSGTLAQGEVFVISHSSANGTILAAADVSTGSGIVSFNGNDAIGLFKNGSLIDILGTFNNGSNFGKNTTLIRKADIGSPNTVYTLSEWDSYPSNTFTDIGSHTYNGSSSPTPPTAPSNVQLSATTSSLDITWNDLSDETGYTLYRSQNNVNFSSIATLGADVTSYSDNTVSLETTYYYYLEAFNTGGTSPASSTVSGATLPLPPSAPSNVSLLATTTDLTVSWDDLTNENGYLLFRSANNVNFSQIASLSANTTGYTDNTVQLLTTYYYYVVAFNGGGNSPNSATVSGQTESTGSATDLFISEYIEGSSYNKALEIANFTGATVNLSGYSLKKQTNGSGSWGSNYSLSGSLAHGQVFVIANSSASSTILAQADVSTGGGIVSFNGNDALALFKNGSPIDVLGTFNGGSGNYAKNVTLVRKESVTGPNSTYTVSEWDSYSSNTFSFLGSHSFGTSGSRLAEVKVVESETATIQLIKTWPNPFDQQLMIAYELDQDTDLQIDLYNLMGQQLKTVLQKTQQTQGQHQHKMDAHDLAPGIYLIMIRTQTSQKVMRVLKR